jgi:hypothetical protein
MTFTRGYWIHDKFMDVAFLVTKIQFQDEKRAKLKGYWYNRGWTGNSFQIFPTTDKLIITDFNGWKRFDDIERSVGNI